MQPIRKTLFMLLAILAIVACEPKNDEPSVPGEPSSKPSWKAVSNPGYQSSMTIVCLPPEGETINAQDEVAVFWDDTCRATATIENGIFYIGISGPENEIAMHIRYYSATYKTIRSMSATYSPHAQWGSTDNPYRLDFTGKKATPKRVVLKGAFPNEGKDISARRVNIGEFDGAMDWVLYWRENDCIRLQAHDGTQASTLSITQGANTSGADFEGWVEELSSSHCVTYPTTAYFSNGDVYYTIPTTQQYVQNNYENNLMPMYGFLQQIEKSSDYRFDMHPIATVLCLSLQSAGGKVVKSIKVTIPEKDSEDPDPQILISGNFKTAGVETASTTVSPIESNFRHVTLACGTGVTLSSEPQDFMMVLPAVDLYSGTTYEITYEEGGTTHSIQKTSKNKLSLGQGKFTQLPVINLD